MDSDTRDFISIDKTLCAVECRALIPIPRDHWFSCQKKKKKRNLDFVEQAMLCIRFILSFFIDYSRSSITR